MVDAAQPVDPAHSEAANEPVPGKPEHVPQPIDRNGVILFAVPMGITTILAWVGDAFAPTLLGSAPVLLILCNPRLRNLVLVAPTLASPVFIGVSIFRLVLTDPFFYWFGRKYGDVAIRWMQDKLGPGASIVLWLEKFFGKASYVAVAAVPNQWICLLAGATRMRIWVFVTLNVGGTVARVMLIWWLGETFSDPILSLNSWITDHRLVLTGVTFAIVGFAMWRAYRKGENQLITADELADELEDARDETLADEAN